MQTMSKMSTSNDGIKDRLSEMPDQVIVHILSLMPIIDAVRTSMLIRRFGTLWTLLPVVRFDYDDYWFRMTRKDGDRPPNFHDQIFPSFARFVRNVLVLHTSTIHTFGLVSRFPSFTATEYREIFSDQMWERLATDKKVKHLYSRCPGISYPSCLFKSKHLETLELIGGTLEDFEHQSQPNMDNLRTLALVAFGGTNKALDQLISGCSCLQELTIINDFHRTERRLSITCPSVKRLQLFLPVYGPCTLNCPCLNILDIEVHRHLADFHLSPPLNLTVIAGMSSLQTVNVDELPWEGCSDLINAFFTLIQNVKVLTITGPAFMGLLFHIEKLKFPENKWKQIVLYGAAWDFESCLEFVFMLMKSSVSLEELIIYAAETRVYDTEFYNPVDSTNCEMTLLKTGYIRGKHSYKKWCQASLQIIEFLLANAVVLEKLVINFRDSKLTSVEEQHLVEQVSGFRRASMNVTIIFV